MYDEFAREYAAHAETSPHNALYERPAVLELLGDVHGRRVLDAACGPGLHADALLERGAVVMGVDASARMIGLARQRVGTAADLRVHDLAEPLDWVANDSFDLVLLALAINYVDDRVTTLRELRRVLRPDGALVVSTSHPTADWQRLGGSNRFRSRRWRSAFRTPTRSSCRRPLLSPSGCCRGHDLGRG